MGVGGQHHALAPLTLGKRHDVHHTAGRVGSRAGAENLSPTGIQYLDCLAQWFPKCALWIPKGL